MIIKSLLQKEVTAIIKAGGNSLEERLKQEEAEDARWLDAGTIDSVKWLPADMEQTPFCTAHPMIFMEYL